MLFCLLIPPISPLHAQSATPSSAQVSITIVHGPARPHREAAQALAQALEHANLSVTNITLDTSTPKTLAATQKAIRDTQPTLIAAGGVHATLLALETVKEIPVVFFMVPNARDARFMQPDFALRHRVTGVTSDIAPNELLDWVTHTNPRLSRLALPHSPHTRHTVANLVEAGRTHGLHVKPIPADREQIPKLIAELDNTQVDGVLMIPDAGVYNSPAVQRLLLWGARQKKPVYTFSKNVIAAGAFAGIYCKSQNIGRQAANIVQQLLAGRKPSEIGLQHPHHEHKAVNVHTAELIGLTSQLDTASATDIEKLGGDP